MEITNDQKTSPAISANSPIITNSNSVQTPNINIRNKQWDLMRAIGIIAVVWGHNYQPPYLFFPAFFFHMSLFFFISGYFFHPQTAIKDKAKYILKKTRKLLLPYLALNLLFGIFTMWLKPMNINLGGDLNFHNMIIAPFGRGDHFTLFLAAWFIFNLYFICVFAALVFQKNYKINIVITVIAFFMMLEFLKIGNNPNNSMWTIFLSRSIFGFFFLSLGYLFRLFESLIQKIIINPLAIIILYLTINILSTNFGNISYSILLGHVSNNIVIVPVITSLSIILIIYSITFYALKALSLNSFIYEIGRHSFSIMVWHLFIFFIVNLFLYEISLIPLSALSDVYFRYNVEKLWLLYQIPAIILPVLLGMHYHLLTQKVKSLLLRLKLINQPSPQFVKI